MMGTAQQNILSKETCTYGHTHVGTRRVGMNHDAMVPSQTHSTKIFRSSGTSRESTVLEISAFNSPDRIKGKRKFDESHLASVEENEYDDSDDKRPNKTFDCEKVGLSLLFAASLMQEETTTSDDTPAAGTFATGIGLLGLSQHGDVALCSSDPSLQLRETSPDFSYATPEVFSTVAAESQPLSTSRHILNSTSSRVSSAAIVSNDESVTQPTELDVLCGRGGAINKRQGNIIYRRVVDYNKALYKQVPKRHRMLVSQSIVQTIINNGGRFLQQQPSVRNEWTEINFRKAVQKTSQALREHKNCNVSIYETNLND